MPSNQMLAKRTSRRNLRRIIQETVPQVACTNPYRVPFHSARQSNFQPIKMQENFAAENINIAQCTAFATLQSRTFFPFFLFFPVHRSEAFCTREQDVESNFLLFLLKSDYKIFIFKTSGRKTYLYMQQTKKYMICSIKFN